MDTLRTVLEELRDEGFTWIRIDQDQTVDDFLDQLVDEGPEVTYDTHEDGTARLFRVTEEGTREEEVYAILFTEAAHKEDEAQGDGGYEAA